MITRCQSNLKLSSARLGKSNCDTSVATEYGDELENDLLSPKRHLGILFNSKQPRCTKSKPFSFEAHSTVSFKCKSRRSNGNRKINSKFKSSQNMLSEMSNHILGSMHDPLKKSTLSSTREIRSKIPHKVSEHNEVTKSHNRSLQQIKPTTRRAPLVPLSPKLHTLSRATARIKFRTAMHNRKEALEKQILEEIKAAEREEAIQLQEDRKNTVHRAKSIRHYKPIGAVHRKSPTKPYSPKFSGVSQCIHR